MTTINIKYSIEATVLTPLSVGQGAEKDWVLGVDYVAKDGEMYHLSMEKIHDAKIDMSKLSQLFIQQDAKGVLLLIGNQLDKVSDFHMRIPCHTTNPIKTFFKNDLTGEPVIPGSSLKGSIRSALFEYFTHGADVTSMQRQRSNALNESVFGSLKEGVDFMRFIQVSDFRFPVGATELVNTKIYNLRRPGQEWQGGWKHGGQRTTDVFDEQGFNTIYECLPFGVTGVGSIALAQKAFQTLVDKVREIPHQQKKQEIMSNSAEFLCQIINEHTRRYLEKELQFFKKYAEGENADLITEQEEFLGSIPTLLEEIANLKPNECIIKMAAGAGFHAMTGDWQYTDYTGGVLDQKSNRDRAAKPKSRKVAITEEGGELFLDLMGFVKLTFSEQK